MIVVSNTSPLHYLILIEAVDVLPELYQVVIALAKVIEELQHDRAPDQVREWAQSMPVWLTVRTPARIEDLNLNPGETHAIALAQEMKAHRLLIDERRAFRVAKSRGLNPVGVLGVLYEASKMKLLDLPQAVGRLTNETNFHVDPALVDELLRRNPNR